MLRRYVSFSASQNLQSFVNWFDLCVKKFFSRNFCQVSSVKVIFINLLKITFRFLIQAAAQKHGVIVSNDKFRDFLRDLSSKDFLQRQTIEQRLLPFVYHEGIFIFPPDPYGRKGPNLDQLLSFWLKRWLQIIRTSLRKDSAI